MLKIAYDYSLAAHNSFGIDAKARLFVEYDDAESLQEYIKTSLILPVLHIGGGNNLLFTRDFEGTVLHSRIKGKELLQIDDSTSVVMLRVGAAEVWDDFVGWCLDQGYYGLENLSLIPSEVGAAAVQNIGAYGSEAKDFIHSVECVDLSTGEKTEFSNNDCCFAYRFSNFKGAWAGRYAITHVTFCLSTTFKPNLTYRALQDRNAEDVATASSLRQTVIAIRRGKLPEPSELGNAGSFFMNPVVSRQQFESLQKDYPDIPHFPAADGVKVPAAWLIEQSGWKGRTLGRAGVYERQPLVLVNRGGATSQEIVDLAKAVIADVENMFGITLRPEVMYV